MFELGDDIEVTVLLDIGVDRKSAVIIDNLYKDPDEIREFSLSKSSDGLKGGMPGNRVFEETDELRYNLKPLFDQLCFDDIWQTNREEYEEQWDKSAYMCNLITDDTIRNLSLIHI